MKLQGRTALVVGASRNIGKATAIAYARQGANLALLARQSSEELEVVAQTCHAFGVHVLTFLADTTLPEQVTDVVGQTLTEFGQIDVLMNCASLRPRGSIQQLSYEDFHHVIALDLYAPFYLCKAVIPAMVERGKGSIIMMGGLATYRDVFGTSTAHVAGKHALAGFVKALAREVGPSGVRVNLLNVSHVDTERQHPEWYQSDTEARTRAEVELAQAPLHRLGHVEEIANAAVFLASDDSSYVTGTGLLCSGGRGI